MLVSTLASIHTRVCVVRVQTQAFVAAVLTKAAMPQLTWAHDDANGLIRLTTPAVCLCLFVSVYIVLFYACFDNNCTQCVMDAWMQGATPIVSMWYANSPAGVNRRDFRLVRLLLICMRAVRVGMH